MDELEFEPPGLLPPIAKPLSHELQGEVAASATNNAMMQTLRECKSPAPPLEARHRKHLRRLRSKSSNDSVLDLTSHELRSLRVDPSKPTASPPVAGERSPHSPRSRLVRELPPLKREARPPGRQDPSAELPTVCVKCVQRQVPPFGVITLKWTLASDTDRFPEYRAYDFLTLHKLGEPPDDYQASQYMQGGAAQGRSAGTCWFVAPQEPGEYVISPVRDMRQVVEALPSCRQDPCFMNLFKDLWACNASRKLQVLGRTQVITVGPALGLANDPV